MITIKDVAQAAGVSPATVSNVINNRANVSEDTRERVKRVMTEMGFRPNANARSLVNKLSSHLGVVTQDLLDPFFSLMAGGIEQACQHHKVQVLLRSGGAEAEMEKRAIEDLLEGGCDALVIHAKNLENDVLVEYAQRIPGFVLVNRYIEEIKSKCVWLDNTLGGELVAEHLLDLGHRNIAVINSNYDIEDPRERVSGIYRAFEKRQLSTDSIYIEKEIPTQDGGIRAAQSLLAKGRSFSALICYNDSMAMGAMSVIQDAGFSIPDDISVTGFDDLPIAQYCFPALTTIRYPICEMAAKATELAVQYSNRELDGINIDGEETSFVYTPVLVPRASSSLK